jgi:BirA family biotin operon repressor/biotin-[acetyl-CoA-carboxylase] ligase
VSHAPPAGWRLQAYGTLASTQDAAVAAARAGEPGHLAILADRQTQGRGSRGRAWSSPAGNLSLSAMIRPGRASPQPGFWALMAGTALHESVALHLADPSTLRLKWPNDLLLDGAKLGGILIDSALAADGALDWVVIGLGVNLRAAPSIEGRTTASLSGTPIAPPELASDILRHLDRWMATPFATLRDAWLDRAHPIGTWLDIATGDGRHAGAFAGLADNGGLLLSNRREPITTGEIFAYRTASRAGEA